MAEGVKHDTGKLPFELLPWDALTAVTRIMRHGQEKYGARNWEGGLRFGRLFGALIRHVTAWWGGEDIDAESGELHLAHAACCVLFLLAFTLRDRDDLDDRHTMDDLGSRRNGFSRDQEERAQVRAERATAVWKQSVEAAPAEDAGYAC